MKLTRLALLAVVVLCACTYFTVRVGSRGWRTGQDLSVHYAGAVAWARGQNPYDSATLAQAWKDRGGADVTPGEGSEWAVYPPGTFLLLAPLSFIPWRGVQAITSVINLAACVAAGWLLVPSGPPPRRFAWFVSILIMAAIQTAISLGQLSLMIIVLEWAALALAQRNRPISSGILFGAAAAIKPLLVAPFIVIHLLDRQWRLVATAASTTIVITSLAALWLTVHHVPWMSDLRANIAASSQPGQINYAGPGNDSAWTMTQIQVPAYRFINTSIAVNALAGL